MHNISYFSNPTVQIETVESTGNIEDLYIVSHRHQIVKLNMENIKSVYQIGNDILFNQKMPSLAHHHWFGDKDVHIADIRRVTKEIKMIRERDHSINCHHDFIVSKQLIDQLESEISCFKDTEDAYFKEQTIIADKFVMLNNPEFIQSYAESIAVCKMVRDEAIMKQNIRTLAHLTNIKERMKLHIPQFDLSSK